jgi:hypothetical protein
MSVLQRASPILVVSLLLVGPRVSEAQTSFEILAGTSWSDGVMSPRGGSRASGRIPAGRKSFDRAGLFSLACSGFGILLRIHR